MKIKPAQADSWIAALPGAFGGLLLFGPDGGLVRERAKAAIKALLPVPDDPFALTELTPEQLKEDPARLADELGALSFTGGNRAVTLRGAGDGTTAVVKSALGAGPAAAFLVVEAGELGARSSLRSLFEGDATLGAIACYRDEERDLRRVIHDDLAAEGLAASSDAMSYLLGNLGGDRRLTRLELDKLKLYMAGRGPSVELDDVLACVGDSAMVTLDDLAYAVADGDLRASDRALRRCSSEAIPAVVILRAVSNHYQKLLWAESLMAEEGQSADTVVRSLRPPIFWKRIESFKRQLSRLPQGVLSRSLVKLLEAESACKSTGSRDDLICARALLGLARSMRPAR